MLGLVVRAGRGAQGRRKVMLSLIFVIDRTGGGGRRKILKDLTWTMRRGVASMQGAGRRSGLRDKIER
jgi:hypothetical protein